MWRVERIEPVFSKKEQGTSGLYASRERAEKSRKITRPAVLEMEGRLSLANYWLYHAAFNLDLFMLFYALAYYLLRHDPFLLMLSISILFLLNCWVSLALVIRRTRDIGWSAWCCWLFALPLIGELFMLFIALRPGQRKSNRAGRPNPFYSKAQHRQIAVLAVLNTALVVLLLMLFQTHIEDASRIIVTAFLELISRR